MGCCITKINPSISDFDAIIKQYNQTMHSFFCSVNFNGKYRIDIKLCREVGALNARYRAIKVAHSFAESYINTFEQMQQHFNKTIYKLYKMKKLEYINNLKTKQAIKSIFNLCII